MVVAKDNSKKGKETKITHTHALTSIYISIKVTLNMKQKLKEKNELSMQLE